MSNLERFTVPKGLIAKIALPAVLLALAKIFYIVIFEGLGEIFYALAIVKGAAVRHEILLRVYHALTFSMFIPFSLALLLTSLPGLKSYPDTLKLRYTGFIVAIFIFIGSAFGLLYCKGLFDLLFTFIPWGVSVALLLPLLTRNWHANTLLMLGSLFTLFSLLNMIGVGIFVLSPRISLTYLLLLIFGLLNITVGYVNLRGITPKSEKIVKIEVLFLVLLSLYRLYIAGGKLL